MIGIVITIAPAAIVSWSVELATAGEVGDGHRRGNRRLGSGQRQREQQIVPGEITPGLQRSPSPAPPAAMITFRKPDRALSILAAFSRSQGSPGRTPTGCRIASGNAKVRYGKINWPGCQQAYASFDVEQWCDQRDRREHRDQQGSPISSRCPEIPAGRAASRAPPRSR